MTKLSQQRHQVLGGIFALIVALHAGLASGASPTDSAGKPNILFILADDLGYGDLGIYGQTDYQTPHLDQLAQEGLRLTQAYANSAVCSAARFGLITGRYQYRLRGGLEEPIPGTKGNIGLPPSHPTLPSLLKKAGYRTALIGKWHLGFLPMYGPLKSGYDQFLGNYAGYIDYFNHGLGPDEPDGLYENESPVRKTGYYTDLLADHASEYLDKLDGRQPFFLSLHFTAPHWPWEGPDDEAEARRINESRGTSNLFHADGGSPATYAKMVRSLDAAIGRVLKTLERRGLSNNT
ncbi:MAG: sulfatase-like hydrolase/transferase, partial [Sterolibacterium sp.]